jgi:Tol biopolymer transport system component
MTWLDRKGQKIGSAGFPDYMESPRLSPDASRVALARIESGGVRSLWVFEFSRGILSRVADRGAFPAWSADGRELVYMNVDENTLVRRKYGSNSPSEVLSEVETLDPVPIDWSPDGKHVAPGMR